MAAEKPTLETHAREILGMPPEWRCFIWQVTGAGVRVTGAVATETYKRGKLKGQINWKLRDKTTECDIVILNTWHQQWLTAWEAKTNKCHNCDGTGAESAGWSVAEGVKHRPCPRCDATGVAPAGKPITTPGGRCA